MSKSVFISHAVKDTNIAAEIVDLIEHGIGVPEAEIFCSSVPGYGIPTGKTFVTYMKEQMYEPKVVILLLTPSYFESKFCLSELGAAWVMSHHIFPILVPPLGYEDVKDVLLGTQVSKINDDLKYNELRDHLAEVVSLNKTSSTKWETKRRAFLKNIEPLMANIAGPTTVPAAKLQEMEAKLTEAQAELDAYEEQVSSLKKQLAETEKLKSKQAVAALHEQFSGGENVPVEQALSELAEDVRDALSVLKYTSVKTFALSEHYGKPYSIDMYNDRPEFEEATRRGVFTTDPSHQAVWSSTKMKKLAQSLERIDTFAQVESGALTKVAMEADEDIPIDPSTQDFWEHHYY
ncbi:toll/interleukin-1 receptor domain-containing protein [Rhizobium leguminosarum]|uniref:toll/interleukin-1 receptor domain-containing protein n=1 Tax=Rhizobium leguminosarum TaxID=384 RepID=UPI001C925E4D|nr:toll/interleukin-1 receptor domain-containing protein [Rhizobium leguminosarum]MBY3044847.1 TIR domain-containing protein [Rhizobium leguminosarum]